jgi:hypothetical protein
MPAKRWGVHRSNPLGHILTRKAPLSPERERRAQLSRAALAWADEGFRDRVRTRTHFSPRTTASIGQFSRYISKSVPQRLNRLRKESLNEGHGFSRAENVVRASSALAAEVRF